VTAKPIADALLGHAFPHYIAVIEDLESAQLSRIDHDGLIKKAQNP
jgi:hypothetical protein